MPRSVNPSAHVTRRRCRRRCRLRRSGRCARAQGVGSERRGARSARSGRGAGDERHHFGRHCRRARGPVDRAHPGPGDRARRRARPGAVSPLTTPARISFTTARDCAVTKVRSRGSARRCWPTSAKRSFGWTGWRSECRSTNRGQRAGRRAGTARRWRAGSGAMSAHVSAREMLRLGVRAVFAAEAADLSLSAFPLLQPLGRSARQPLQRQGRGTGAACRRRDPVDRRPAGG